METRQAAWKMEHTQISFFLKGLNKTNISLVINYILISPQTCNLGLKL